jgi:hypothetical protein
VPKENVDNEELVEAPTLAQRKTMGKKMFAYAPTNDPADWKLPLGPPGSTTPTTKYIGMAAAACFRNFRGKTADVPADAKPAIKRKIRAAYKSLDIPKADWPDYIRESANMLSEAVLGGRSFSEYQDDLKDALEDEGVFSRDSDNGFYVQDTWDDHVVVSAYGDKHGYFVVPYTEEDGEFAFGDPVEVERKDRYVPVAKESEPDKPVWTSIESKEPDRLLLESTPLGTISESKPLVESAMVILEVKGKQDNGSLKIEGVSGRFDDDYINANGRFYERKLAPPNLVRLNAKAANHELTGLADHPSDGTGSITDRALVYEPINDNKDAVWLDEHGFLHFTGYIMPTMVGKDLIVQAEHGVAIPFSWRGVGREEVVEKNGKKALRVCEGYELITWDAVNEASCEGTGAQIKESTEMAKPEETKQDSETVTTEEVKTKSPPAITMTKDDIKAMVTEAAKEAAAETAKLHEEKDWETNRPSLLKEQAKKIVEAEPKLKLFEAGIYKMLEMGVKTRDDLEGKVAEATAVFGAQVTTTKDNSIGHVGIMTDRREMATQGMLLPEGVCTGQYRDIERPDTVMEVIDLLSEGLTDRPLPRSVVEMIHSGRVVEDDAQNLMDNKEYQFRRLMENYRNSRAGRGYLYAMTKTGFQQHRALLELTQTSDIAAGAPFFLPIVRDIYPRIIDAGLWGTQVIDRPTSRLTYLHYKTDPGEENLNSAASGQFDTEESEQPPEIKAVIDSEDVTVEKKGVSYEYKVEAQQDMAAYYNLDLQSDLLGVGRDRLGFEWFWSNIAALIAAQTGGNANFGTEYPAGYSQDEWDNVFPRAIIKHAGDMASDPGCVARPNIVLLGSDQTFRLITNNAQSGFTVDDGGLNPAYQFGVRQIGNFKGIFKAYEVDRWPQYMANVLLLGYSGNNWMDQGAVFAMYIPLYTGPIIEDATGTRVQAMFSRNAFKVLRPKSYGKFTVLTGETGTALG